MLHYDDIPSPFLILQGILTSISALFPNLLNLGWDWELSSKADKNTMDLHVKNQS